MAATIQKHSWYWEVVIRCQEEHYELLSFHLFEMTATGIMELSTQNGRMDFTAFFDSRMLTPEKGVRDLLDKIEQVNQSAVLVSVERKEYQDWRSGWKKYFKPLIIGESFLVRPPWENTQADKLEIVIEPGQGFGTGYHQSTAIALELQEWVKSRVNIEKVLDVGAGSGILSIGALLLGADHVTAIDIDGDALKEIPKNLSLSGLNSSRCITINQDPRSTIGEYDLVMANIENQVLTEIMEDLQRLTKPSGYLILSGILVDYQLEFAKGLPDDMKLVKELQKDEWCGFVLMSG